MGIDEIITRIRSELGDDLLRLEQNSPERVYVGIASRAVTDVSRLMFEVFEARFQIATGVDTREGIELMYHWAFDNDGFVVTVRTLVSHRKPEIDSIAPICVAAEWIEREIWELLGVYFCDHPDLRHLLLDENWPEGDYPLRHDFRQKRDGVTP